MSDFTEVAQKGELKDGAMKKVDVGGKEVLLARAGERYYCVQGRCPHLGGDLSRGTLKGTVIECPLHHSQFDLSDGRVVRWTDWSGPLLRITKALKSPRPLQVYEVKVEGDKVFVRT